MRLDAGFRSWRELEEVGDYVPVYGFLWPDGHLTTFCGAKNKPPFEMRGAVLLCIVRLKALK